MERIVASSGRLPKRRELAERRRADADWQEGRERQGWRIASGGSRDDGSDGDGVVWWRLAVVVVVVVVAGSARREPQRTQSNESRGGARAARATFVPRHVNATTWSSA